MHVGLAPPSPNLEQAGRTRFKLTKGMPFFFMYKNQEIKKFVKSR